MFSLVSATLYWYDYYLLDCHPCHCSCLGQTRETYATKYCFIYFCHLGSYSVDSFLFVWKTWLANVSHIHCHYVDSVWFGIPVLCNQVARDSSYWKIRYLGSFSPMVAFVYNICFVILVVYPFEDAQRVTQFT